MELIPIMGMVTGIITTLGFFIAIVLSIKYITTARNREKMALIEKGVDLSQIYKSRENKKTTLKAGMFLVGISIGLFVAYTLENNTGINAVVAYFSMILLFGGTSLILFHRLDKKQSDG